MLPATFPEVPNASIADAALDGDLRTRILHTLGDRGIATSGLTFSTQDRRVAVHGRVRSYYERQLIVHLIRTTPGVRGVHDFLEVVAPLGERRLLCSRGFTASRRKQLASAVALTALALVFV